MDERQQDSLRLQPHMIPALRTSFRAAVDQLATAIGELRRGGNLSAPWLGDETSNEVAAHYTLRAMNAPDSSYQSLVAYHSELKRIHDTLHQMEADYLRNENQTADTFRLRT